MRVKVSKYVVADTEICHGKPTFKGTRILVSDVLELLAAGEPVEKILKSYSGLTEEMVRDSLNYVARLVGGEHFVEFEVPAR